MIIPRIRNAVYDDPVNGREEVNSRILTPAFLPILLKFEVVVEDFEDVGCGRV